MRSHSARSILLGRVVCYPPAVFALALLASGCSDEPQGMSNPPDLAPPLDPDPTHFEETGSLGTARSGHTATLLSDGRVLVVGGEDADRNMIASVELWDPATSAFTPGPALPQPRGGHTATLLADGRVLVVGGGRANPIGAPSGQDVRRDALIFDPGSARWLPAGETATPRHFHTATLLDDGSVLVVGGGGDSFTLGPIYGGPEQAPYAHAVATAERFDPETGAWSAVGSLAAPRFLHRATRLADGRVILTGGGTDVDQQSYATTEIYDPNSRTFSAGPTFLGADRFHHGAVALAGGQVLAVAGKKSNTAFLKDAELLDADARAWSSAGAIETACTVPGLVALSSGKALLTGGNRCVSSGCFALDQATLFDPAGGGSWTPIAPLVVSRYWHTTTRLPDGRMLLVGGFGDLTTLASAELAVP